jgi:hypothetical protein
MGQILLYILTGPLLMRLWPELEMTREQVDRIAKHIGDFSLTYLRQAKFGARQARASSKSASKIGEHWVDPHSALFPSADKAFQKEVEKAK